MKEFCDLGSFPTSLLSALVFSSVKWNCLPQRAVVRVTMEVKQDGGKHSMNWEHLGAQ